MDNERSRQSRLLGVPARARVRAGGGVQGENDVPPVGGNEAQWLIWRHNSGVMWNLDMV